MTIAFLLRCPFFNFLSRSGTKGDEYEPGWGKSTLASLSGYFSRIWIFIFSGCPFLNVLGKSGAKGENNTNPEGASKPTPENLSGYFPRIRIV